jgi:hypothetical protein
MYKVAVPGKDVLVVDDNNYHSMLNYDKRFHILKINFSNDIVERTKNIVHILNVNRFIIDNIREDVKLYNSIFRNMIGKKYYVKNQELGGNLISFFRKNNKVVFSFPDIEDNQVWFDFFNEPKVFKDVLTNCEVVIMREAQFNEKKPFMRYWRGNVIIHDDNYII